MVDRSLYTDSGYDIPPELGAIYTPKIIWALEHPQSGCLLTIREVGTPLTQTCFFIQWRFSGMYKCKPIDVPGAIFVRQPGEDGDALERATIAKAYELLAAGPNQTTLDGKAKWDRENPPKRFQAQGAAATNEKTRKQREEARVASGAADATGAAVRLPSGPVEPTASDAWDIKGDWESEGLMYGSRESTETWIEITIANDETYRVRRHFKNDAIATGDIVATLAPKKDGRYTRDEAVAAANYLATTDYKNWKRGEYQKS